MSVVEDAVEQHLFPSFLFKIYIQMCPKISGVCKVEWGTKNLVGYWRGA